MNNPFTKEDLEIIVATMHRTSMDFLFQMFPDFATLDCSVLVINQTDEGECLESTHSKVRVINVVEKGLSNSRNLGLANAQKKIIAFADDDIKYQPDFTTTIIEAHNQFPQAVAIQHQIDNPTGLSHKKYPSKVRAKLSVLQLFSVVSIELSVNIRVLQTTSVAFDDRFGLGASFEMGEEAIFLLDLHRQKQQIAFVPKIIATHTEKSSTDRFDFKKRYYIQGAFLSRVREGAFSYRIWQKLFFDWKQRKLKNKDVLSAYQYALAGRRDFYK